MDELDDNAKAVILQYLQDQYLKKPDYSFLAPEIYINLKKDLEKFGFDTIEKTIGLVKIMAESKLLHERNGSYQISIDGRTVLETHYNDDWVSAKMAEHARKQKEIEQVKKDQFELEERRHKDTIRWSKWGVIGSIITAIMAIIISIIALFRSA